MTQKAQDINKELIARIVRIQSELDEIKSEIGINEKDLSEEIGIWEEAGVNDSVDFFEENSL